MANYYLNDFDDIDDNEYYLSEKKWHGAMESGLEARIQRLKSKDSASTSELVFLQKMLTKHKRRQADSWMQQHKLQLKKRLQRLREDVRTECGESGEWTDFEFASFS